MSLLSRFFALFGHKPLPIAPHEPMTFNPYAGAPRRVVDLRTEQQKARAVPHEASTSRRDDTTAQSNNGAIMVATLMAAGAFPAPTPIPAAEYQPKTWRDHDGGPPPSSPSYDSSPSCSSSYDSGSSSSSCDSGGGGGGGGSE